MSRQYPAFIIDRSRRSAESRFQDDFIVCTDKEVGFIAKLYKLPKSRREQFEEGLKAMPESVVDNRYLIAAIGESVCVLEVVKMLHEPVAHMNRLRPLMKKAMKAYLYGEEAAVRRDGLPFDQQIAAIDDVIRTARSQRSRLEEMTGKSGSDRFINALKSARESVELLQKITKHEYGSHACDSKRLENEIDDEIVLSKKMN